MSAVEPETPVNTDLALTKVGQKIFNVQEIAKKANIEGLEFEAADNLKVGNTPILDNGLNLLYAPQSYGKSFTAINIAVESGLPSLFIDLESNGKLFTNYCGKHGVPYVYAGDVKDIITTVKKLAQAIKEKHEKAFIIIDSYSDLFQDDEGKMAQFAQKSLGNLHRFFMREVRMPALILDHATEIMRDGVFVDFKIEGNKSGKFKKTVCVLRLDKIDGDITNGTYVTVERSRNQDVLPIGHIQYYHRNNYLVKKIQSCIDSKKLNEEFTAKDLEQCLSGDDRKQWRDLRDEIATSRKEVKKTFWKLNPKE